MQERMICDMYTRMYKSITYCSAAPVDETSSTVKNNGNVF